MDFWEDIAIAKKNGVVEIECWECRYWSFNGECMNPYITIMYDGRKKCRHDDFCIYGKPLVYCPKCGSRNTTRFQWSDNNYFEYWTCWDCDYNFTVEKR